MSGTLIRDATEADIPALTVIHNWGVRETTALWTTQEVDAGERRAWLEERRHAGLPVLVAESEAGVFVGYGAYMPWRAKDGYRLTVEHSVYVSPGHAGKGIGRALMRELIERARAQGLHAMVGMIESENVASIALHERFGFEVVGWMPQVGQKFGRWLNLTIMQLTLDNRETPETPL
jgi:L-amino acid N-acyltransferase YncA